MPKFRKKPVEIVAVQLRSSQWSEVCELLGPALRAENPRGAMAIPREEASDTCDEMSPYIALNLRTAHGEIAIARHGDWIIPEPNAPGRFYPCKPRIFEATYDPVGYDLVDIIKPVAVALAQQFQARPSDLLELAALRTFRDRILSLRAEVGVIAAGTMPGPEDKDILAEFGQRIEALFEMSPVNIRGEENSDGGQQVCRDGY